MMLGWWWWCVCTGLLTMYYQQYNEKESFVNFVGCFFKNYDTSDSIVLKLWPIMKSVLCVLCVLCVVAIWHIRDSNLGHRLYVLVMIYSCLNGYALDKISQSVLLIPGTPHSLNLILFVNEWIHCCIQSIGLYRIE